MIVGRLLRNPMSTLFALLRWKLSLKYRQIARCAVSREVGHLKCQVKAFVWCTTWQNGLEMKDIKKLFVLMIGHILVSESLHTFPVKEEARRNHTLPHYCPWCVAMLADQWTSSTSGGTKRRAHWHDRAHTILQKLIKTDNPTSWASAMPSRASYGARSFASQSTISQFTPTASLRFLPS